MGRSGIRAWVALIVVLSLVVGLAACESEDAAKEPDATGGETATFAADAAASRSDLEQTAPILQRRLRALGARDADVRVRAQTLVATGTDLKGRAARALQPGVLEFRPVLAILPPSAGQETADVDGGVLPGRPASAGSLRYQVGPAVLTDKGVRSAKAVFLGGAEGWVIELALRRKGTRAFNELAAKLYPKVPPQNSVALVLDGVVQSAPAFQVNRFKDRVVQISGGFTEAEAKEIAATVQFGPLPVPLRIR